MDAARFSSQTSSLSQIALFAGHFHDSSRSSRRVKTRENILSEFGSSSDGKEKERKKEKKNTKQTVLLPYLHFISLR